MPEVAVRAGTVHLPALLAESPGGRVPQRGAPAHRRRRASSVDGEPVSDLDLDAAALDGRVIRAGKRRFAARSESADEARG